MRRVVEVDWASNQSTTWIMVGKVEYLKVYIPVDRDLKVDLEWLGPCASEQGWLQLRSEMEEEILHTTMGGTGG